jgi:multiple sugar transport system permease protein
MDTPVVEARPAAGTRVARRDPGQSGQHPADHRRSALSRRRRTDKRRRRTAIVGLLAPFAVTFALSFLAPLGYAVYESFFRLKRSGLGLTPPTRVFAGFANYTQALRDRGFTGGVGRVLLFGAVQVPVMLGVALALALVVDAKKDRLARWFRLAAFLPYAVPGVIGAIMWAFLYLKGSSPFVQAFSTFGIDVDFLSRHLVLASIANIVTWTWTGYNMIIIYSALQAVPVELYQAADVDGCGPWRTAWHIKIPLVAPALVLTGVFSIIGTVQLYNEPTVLRALTASTINATYTPNMAVQNVAFTFDDYNLSAAMAVLLALGTFALSFGFLHLTRRFTERSAA